MIDLSVIIPSRSDSYLRKTIEDLLAKSETSIEIIVVLDGIWTDSYVEDTRVIYIHHGTVHDSRGMRASINRGVAISKGKYIMKCDEHIMVSQGYDRVLIADCEDDEIIIPSRGRLDAEKWEVINDGRANIDYMYVEYPYLKPLDKTQGLHGAEWKRPERTSMKDETPTMQGSCYFMKRSYWDTLFPNGLDDEKYGTFTAEAQELSMTAWLSGGKVMVNKNVIYYHFHKGKTGKSYNFSTEQYKKHCADMEKGRLYCIEFWTKTKQFKHDFEWFIDQKFPDMPKWPKDWKARLEIDKLKDYSTLQYKDDYWLSNLRKENG